MKLITACLIFLSLTSAFANNTMDSESQKRLESCIQSKFMELPKNIIWKSYMYDMFQEECQEEIVCIDREMAKMSKTHIITADVYEWIKETCQTN